MATSAESRCTISKLSMLTGCNAETIRYYERIGLLPEPPRSAGGHRIYLPHHVGRLSAVRRCRDLGFSLEEIRELLGLVDGGSYTCEEARRIGTNHLSAIRRKVAALSRLESTLTGLVARCSGDNSADCPLIDALFAPGSPLQEVEAAGLNRAASKTSVRPNGSNRRRTKRSS